MPDDKKVRIVGFVVFAMAIIMFQFQFVRSQNRLDERQDRLEAQIEGIKRLIDQKK